MKDYKVSELGECYGSRGGFRVFKQDGYYSIYNVYEDEAVPTYINFVHLESLESALDEAELELAEMMKEFNI